MNEEISKLIDLQAVDTEIAGFDQEINNKEREILEREQAIEEKKATSTAHREKIQKLETKQRELKSESEDVQIRIKDRQGKMMQVQTSREHQALLKEIEDAKKLLKESDEATIAIMEQIEQLEADATELENLCKGEEKLLEEARAEVDKAVKEINTRRKKVVGKRDKLSKDVKSVTLKRYNLLLEKCNNNAVVAAEDGVCRGCFMAIPPQQFNEIRKGERIHHCPTCQRILFFREEEQEKN